MQVAVVVSKQEVGDFNALAHVFVHFGLGILQIGTTSFIFSTKKSTLINDSKTTQTKVNNNVEKQKSICGKSKY